MEIDGPAARAGYSFDRADSVFLPFSRRSKKVRISAFCSCGLFD
jgi:hypothetical protein